VAEVFGFLAGVVLEVSRQGLRPVVCGILARHHTPLPIMSLWLDISLTAALVANLGLLAFFFFYAIAFTWCFDRVFGLPASALAGPVDRG
jgi:hypothetical protein